MSFDLSKEVTYPVPPTSKVLTKQIPFQHTWHFLATSVTALARPFVCLRFKANLHWRGYFLTQRACLPKLGSEGRWWTYSILISSLKEEMGRPQVWGMEHKATCPDRKEVFPPVPPLLWCLNVRTLKRSETQATWPSATTLHPRWCYGILYLCQSWEQLSRSLVCMIPNLLTAINFKNTLYRVLRYLQDFPHNIPQRTSTTCLNNNTVELQTLNTEHFLRIFLPSLFGALLETCLHCARTVELLERKAIREKRPRQILSFHCWNPWKINSDTQTTEKILKE